MTGKDNSSDDSGGTTILFDISDTGRGFNAMFLVYERCKPYVKILQTFAN